MADSQAPVVIRAGKHKIPITHPERVVYPEDGITKLDVIRYYEEVAQHMLPLLRNRPLTMERYPENISKGGFFQKEIGPYFPSWIPRVTLPKEDGTVTHVLCNDRAALLYLANQNCLIYHISLARADQWEYPDQLVFDLDPPADFEQARRVALWLKGDLEDLGLTPFVKTTGGRGLHVLIPIRRTVTFEDARTIARWIAERLAARVPEEITMEQRKSDRGERLFLDVNRNGIAQTVVAPYSLRARAGAPVAAPISWEELREGIQPQQFNLRTMPDRLRQGIHPWRGMRLRAAGLEAILKRVKERA
jgi:bifunctional non-homologous end joining protein LigD